MIGVKEMIVVRKINSERPKVEKVWCEEQVHDVERLIESVEDLIAAAVASNNSPHQYAMLQLARNNFISDLLNTAEKYRILAEAK
jgi:hypothetical protein